MSINWYLDFVWPKNQFEFDAQESKKKTASEKMQRKILSPFVLINIIGTQCEIAKAVYAFLFPFTIRIAVVL